jgi:hypothetical protein
MQNDRSLEPPDRAAPGVNPSGSVDVHDGDPAVHASGPMDPPGTSSRGWGPFARLLSVVRGDKYMADAYEPACSTLMETRAGGARKER